MSKFILIKNIFFFNNPVHNERKYDNFTHNQENYFYTLVTKDI